MSSISFLGARRVVAVAASASTRRPILNQSCKAASPQVFLNSRPFATFASNKSEGVLNPARPEDEPSVKDIKEQFQTLEKLLDDKFEFVGEARDNDLKALLKSDNTNMGTSEALLDLEKQNPAFLKEVQKELAETNMKLAQVAMSNASNDEALVDARLTRLKDLLKGRARLHSP